MAWANRNVRTTEWVLEEMYQTGRLWMNDSARRRRLAHAAAAGPVSGEGVGEAEDLRRRFEHLFSEFCERIEGE
jgi:hypothetical protein